MLFTSTGFCSGQEAMVRPTVVRNLHQRRWLLMMGPMFVYFFRSSCALDVSAHVAFLGNTLGWNYKGTGALVNSQPDGNFQMHRFHDRRAMRTRCRIWGLEDVEPASMIAAGAIGAISFVGRMLWSLVQFGVAGAVLTRVLPWGFVQVPGPVGIVLSFLYAALAVYGSFAEKAGVILWAGMRYMFRGPAVAAKSLQGADVRCPSWEDLEVAHRQFVEQGFGPAPDTFHASTTKVRLFSGSSEGDINIVFWRDAAAWCPYCMKTQLYLEECQISYRVEWVNMSSYGAKRSDFFKLSPNGLLPVAEIDGEVVRDSDGIIARLGQLCGASHTNPLMLPNVSNPRYLESKQLIELAYDLQGRWMNWARSPVNDPLCKDAFVSVLNELEEALSRNEHLGPFVLGDFSIVECHLAPILERAAASLAYYKGFMVRKVPDAAVRHQWPRIERWFKAMQQRASYRSLSGDFYTHSHDLPPQLGVCARNGSQQAARCEAYVDGLRGSEAWLLPLSPIDPFEPDAPSRWQPLNLASAEIGELAQAERLEAAERLIRNRVAVTTFCLRALSPPGFPPVRAQLADPNAAAGISPSALDGDRLLVDCALRHVVDQLLHGKGSPFCRNELSGVLHGSGLEATERWRECLRYLQLRVGVPRDMGAGAARQLRAHLGSLIAA